MNIGQEMMMMKKMNQPMPDLVKDEPGDCSVVRAIKAAIRAMTFFEPKERQSMQQVMNILNAERSMRKCLFITFLG